MFEPEDIPDDNLDDLLDLEYEAEMDLMRELEEEAAIQSQVIDSGVVKEARTHLKESKTFAGDKKVDSENIINGVEVTSKSPSAKRPKMSENQISFDSPNVRKKHVLEDISNFRPVSDFAAKATCLSQMSQPDSRILNRIPADSDYLPVTSHEGNRFYIRMNDDSNDGDPDLKCFARSARMSGLCGVPYNELLEKATLESSKLMQTNLELDAESGYESHQEESGEDIESLWVEKFRPKSYLQLLSDDGTNRVLLRWLKLWDKLVFGKEKKVQSKPNKEVNEAGDGKKFGSGQANTEVIEDLDESGRPKQKVALLHGPPGLGKTTLAHVVAKHAGYNVVEMNASDDRSIEAFKNKLESATQMKSVSERDKRPNCLVIDEIDGAPAPTIQFLVGLITGTGNTKSAKKKGPTKTQMQRPIVCICNDLYTPALRNLRQHALIIPFPPTLSQRLAQRLLDIAGREQLHTDLTALLALCEKTGDDIRACLSTLQFFKSRGQRLRLSDVNKTQLGQKDVQKSHFTVWDEIFRIPRTLKRRIDDEEVNVASAGARFRNVLSTVQACGDYDRLQQGVFENYLSLKFKDSKMENVAFGQDWFCFFDLAHQQIMHTQNYSIMAYLSYSFVMSHFLFSTFQKSRISYPTTATEKRNAQQKSENIIETLRAEMSPTSRAFNPISLLVRDTLPYIMTIMQPNLRPVNTHLYSLREKEELQNLVKLLISYNLNFVQERTLEGSYVYRLEPCVEEVVFFPEQNHSTMPYAIKQMIAHEVQMEIMRRKEGADHDDNKIENDAMKNSPAPNQKRKVAGEDQMRSMKELTKKLQAKDVQVKECVPVDFFGRPIVSSKPARSSDHVVNLQVESDGILSSDVWFRFKEGYNNAVRRNIRIQDLA